MKFIRPIWTYPSYFLNRNKKPGEFSTESQLRTSDGQGPFTAGFKLYVPRKVETAFYEFLREAIPLIDAGIWKLVDLDGHLIVKGENEALVDEIKDWIDNVPVNDLQKGLQAFHQNISNETFEQGFGIGEFLPDKKRTDIISLRVADSKTIKFSRTATGIDIYQRADGDQDFRLLKANNLLYQSIHNENANPYGTSVMRSMEFVGKVLATMHNSLLNNWERFGDPSFEIIYKASKKGLGDATVESRRKTIADEFHAAMKKKREGYSQDFVRAIDKDSDISIKVIGSDNQLLELEVPARHVEEQIIAKFGIPSWMLGKHWSTTERLADKEVTMLQESRLHRHKAKLPVYTNLVKNLLLLRGRTWKKGDWWLEFESLNLHDIVAKAQERFLNLQGDYYIVQNATAMGVEVDPAQLSSAKALKAKANKSSTSHLSYSLKSDQPKCSCGKTHEGEKELHRPVQWPKLDAVEQEYEKVLKYEWEDLRKKVFTILKLPQDVGARSSRPAMEKGGNTTSLQKQDPPPGLPEFDAFTFSNEQRSQIMKALEDTLGFLDIADENSPVKWYYGESYSLGLIQAANMIGQERPILDIIKNQEIFNDLCQSGFTKVKDRATLYIKNKILPEIEGQVIAGTNPRHVATMLNKRFGEANSDWERLARTEMSASAERAKLDEWKEQGVDTEGGIVAGYDTHPRCKCANSVQKKDGKWVVVFVASPDACAQCLALATN